MSLREMRKIVGHVIFKTNIYSGEILNDTDEAIEHRFFDKTSIPENINAADKQVILEWVEKTMQVVVD